MPKAITTALVVLGVLLTGLPSDPSPSTALPTTSAVFGLDLEVVGTAESGVVYVLEQRARPNYRVFRLDPGTGTIETIFEVPEGGLIFGMALDPSGERLALGYTHDYSLEGSGLWILDIASGSLTELVETASSHFLTDLAWTEDGTTVLATSIEYVGSDELLSAVSVDTKSGLMSTLAEDAINPVQLAGVTYILTVDADNARRAVGVLTDDGSLEAIDIGGGAFDLDHLTVDADSTSLMVAALEPTETGLTLGDPALAHGSHDLPSVWWTIDVVRATGSQNGSEAVLTYDAIVMDDAVVSVTGTGLQIEVDGETTDVLTSRALRFVAG